MRKKIIPVLLTLVISAGVFASAANAATIVLKSGSTLVGKIIEQTKEKVIVEFQGVHLTFDPDEISRIDNDSGKGPAAPGLSAPTASDTAKPKTLKIVYKSDMKMIDSNHVSVMEQKGEKTVYINTALNKRREEEKTSSDMNGLVSQRTQTNIFDGKKLYTLMPEKKQAAYFEVSKEGVPVFGAKTLSDNEKPMAEEEILGEKCQVYGTDENKIWMWNGIALKEEAKSEGIESSTVATDIQENIDLDDSLFEVPPDYEVKSQQVMMADAIKSMGNSMKSLGSTLKSQGVSTNADGKINVDDLEKLKMSSNDALAKAMLHALSTGSETYATANSGRYAESMDTLIKADPPYISKDYCDQDVAGFRYACHLDAKGYTFTATPKTAGESGTTTFTITTGGILKP